MLLSEVILYFGLFMLLVCTGCLLYERKKRKEQELREARITRFYELKDQLDFRVARKKSAQVEISAENMRLAIESLPTRTVKRYEGISFKNVVLPSGYNTPYTEIDEIIVSPYGIFCIEYKAHVGIIFGSENNKYWTQCKYSEKVAIPNPLRQNYKHIKALEKLLGRRIKAPIHNYVVFTNAKKLQVDSTFVFDGTGMALLAIDNHTKQIYSLEEWGEILDILARASSKSAALLPVHIETLNHYLTAR